MAANLGVNSRPLLRRRTSLSGLLQPVLDVSFVGVLFFAIGGADGQFISLAYLLFYLLLVGGMALIYDGFGIYRRHRPVLIKLLDIAMAWTVSFAIATGVLYTLDLVLMIGYSPLGELFVAGYLFQATSHCLFRAFITISGASKKLPTLVVGQGTTAQSFAATLDSNPWAQERVVDTLLTDPESSADQVLCQIEQSMAEHGLRVIYLIVPIEQGQIAVHLYRAIASRHVDVHWVPDTQSLELVNPSIKEVSGSPVISFSETPLLGLQHHKKIVLDRAAALLALLVLSPIMLVTAGLIRLTSPGPVFFKQKRTGWDGRVFEIWKFRSMRVDANPEGQVIQTTKEDPRVTRIGRFIRKTSIDELPQLFNVLNGSMSLVGPRPHAIQHDQEYSALIDSYLTRHRIKPGITGLAQVRGFRGETETVDLMAKRVAADLEYINTWSIWLDLKIILRTALTLLGSGRAY